MTELVTALRALGLEGEIASSGRWLTFQGELCTVYVVEGTWGTAYYTWCADPRERTVECYPTATAAIQAGVRRAARLHASQRSTLEPGFPWTQRDGTAGR